MCHCCLSKISRFSSIRGLQSFTNCSVGLQLDFQNVRLTKWSVRKDIWMSEQFPEFNMTSCRNSFKVNSFQMIQFPNQLLNKINCAFDKISLISQTVLKSETRSFLPTVQLDFSWTLEMSNCQNVQSTKWS